MEWLSVDTLIACRGSMKGSTVDAMSDAVDNAEVMLFCVSLEYKESANCRLEANYCMQQEVDMIPLMMQRGYKPRGWLVRVQTHPAPATGHR